MEIYHHDIETAFRDFLAENGHPLDKALLSDTENFNRYRCLHSSDKNNKNVSYKLYTNGYPAGCLECFSCDIKLPWRFKNPANTKSNLFNRPVKSARSTTANQKQILPKIDNEWNTAKSCITHPYLKRKNLLVQMTDGLRITAEGILLLPIRSETNELVSLQKILWSSSENKFIKRFRQGSSPKNGFFLIGDISSSDKVYLAEGIATTLTIKEGSGCPVVCTFGKRFDDIGPIIRKIYPSVKIIFCADRDKDNGSVENAIKACEILQSNCAFTVPSFENSSDTPNKLSDFNDLFSSVLAETKDRETALEQVRLNLLNDNKEVDMLPNKKPNFNLAANDAISKKDSIVYPNVKGDRILNTYQNLNALLTSIGIELSWNIMKRNIEVSGKAINVFEDDKENSICREIANLAEINGMPTTKINDHIMTLAQNNSYHPILRFLESNCWDGIPRLENFIRKSIKSSKPELAYILVRKWLLSAIAALYSLNGYPAQGVLVLQGAQGIGKTSWFKHLDPLNCGAILEGMVLDVKDKDCVITSLQHLIVELGEIEASFARNQAGAFKSFLTKQQDILRVPYGRCNSTFNRRTIYGASVNETNFLIDETGNRRFWVVPVHEINIDHDLDMRQIWLELHHNYKLGEKEHLTLFEKEQLNASNEEHSQIDPIKEKILKTFGWDDSAWRSNAQKFTATDVIELIGIKINGKSTSLATQVGRILTSLTGKSPIHRKHCLPPIKVAKQGIFDN